MSSLDISVRLLANQGALNAYVNDVVTEYKHKKKAYALICYGPLAYAYVAAVLTGRLPMLMFTLMLASQVRTSLKKTQK